MSTYPIRLDRVQAGLVASVAAALPSAVAAWEGEWTPDGTAGDLFALLRVTSGFDASPRGGESRPTRTLPLAATLTIDAPMRVWISGMWWEATDAADLLEQLDAVPLLSATYEAAGDVVTFEATAPGDLYGLGPAAAWVVDTSTVAEVLVESISGACSIDLYSRARGLRSGAMADLQRWRSQVGTTPGRELLDRYGLAIADPIRILPLDALAGPRWDSRARASFNVTTLAVDATATIPTIDTATVTMLGDASGSFDIEIP